MATYQFTGRIKSIEAETSNYIFSFESNYKVNVIDLSSNNISGNNKIYDLAQNKEQPKDFQEIPESLLSSNKILTTLLISNIKEYFHIEYEEKVDDKKTDNKKTDNEETNNKITTWKITKVTLIND